MRVKVFKPAMLVLLALLAARNTGFAQDVSVNVSTGHDITLNNSINGNDFQLSVDGLAKSIKAGIKDITKNMSVSVRGVVPKIKVDFDNMGNDLAMDISPKINIDLGNLSFSNDDDNNSTSRAEKTKSYSKSYPIDGNDKIKLSNQFGKITVNTWDKREVKVDVQIKAEANSDEEAQRLIDGVRITDGKAADQVSFKTDIERFNGNGNRNRKLEINYTVYMPARTDLNVEDSYGSISLPDLEGRVKISSSYGSCQAQNLSNPNNDIEGSYGSMKVGKMNGGKLDYSYGSVDMEECTNLRADLSYGSFKLGRLKGTGEFDLSYVGGFKIDELTSTLKKLTVETSYSGVSIGVSNASFDFDVSTSYGGFNYNDDKVTVTSKNPPDGSKHIGTSRNYKGHVGKGGSDATVRISTSYGGVNFE